MASVRIPGDALCRFDDLPDGDTREAREFEGVPAAAGAARSVSIFVVRLGDEVRGYANRCPHRGTPLNLMPGRFLTADRGHAICATHGALFRLDDGRCVAGPCVGDSLDAVPLQVVDGIVHLAAGRARAPDGTSGPG